MLVRGSTKERGVGPRTIVRQRTAQPGKGRVRESNGGLGSTLRLGGELEGRAFFVEGREDLH